MTEHTTRTAYRTHTCGELRTGDIGETVTVSGWVANWRDHGGLVFIDLRDRYGLTQVVFNPERAPEAHKTGRGLRSEYVVKVTGQVNARIEGAVNPRLATGEIEVYADEVRVLSESLTPPFEIDETAVAQEGRLRHRYIDLRRPAMQRNIIFRHKVIKVLHDYFDSLGFLEIETPMLTKSTPEGARDFLVPSRLNPGRFYALPQSPQLFKQILMVAGYDRYVQIARCFRDEDLRADRQPEFTQLDVEMAFVSEEDIIAITEGALAAVFLDTLGIRLETPFPHLAYDDCMARYGTDKPDLRFGLEIADAGDLAAQSDFRVFTGAVASGGEVRGICAPGAAGITRKRLDELTALVGESGAKGLAWFRVKGGALDSPLAKFFGPGLQSRLIERMAASDGDMLFFVADESKVVSTALGELRLQLAKDLALIPEDTFVFTWVTDYPLFEFNPEEGRPDVLHHPFTSPREEDVPLLDSDPLAIRARAYDVVLNGVELGGGSIRIHRSDIQEKVFAILKIKPEEARVKFGFLLDALQYGAPPHGGIALGLDRLIMLMLRLDSIREVIAFPKTAKGVCLMTDAPSVVEGRQLKELGLT